MKSAIATRRYQLLDKIGKGDFATTYSARDLKLDRDVAIKQLHKQYMDDDAKLSRYWREAQMLAALEHPNNMTIYDVDRERGRLVLELMQGSLKQIYANVPMPIEDVRQTLIQGLRGLECLHENGILHGDVSPQNLFLSRQEVVKLGDFGLARRIEDDEGSLLKGNAQYIAPEIVSRDFGDVGPASDLYSLGFSALELLVGPDFESLFPDLIAFGRDRKMAWMMWHCAADRRIPPIHSILDGVPDDLAHVIARLTTKDQRLRYRTATEALGELNSNPVPVGRSLKEQAELEAAEAKRKLRQRRKLAAFSWVVSIAVSCAIWYFSLDPPPAPPRVAPPSVQGVVKNVLPLDQKLVLDLGKDWKEIGLSPDDVVLLNRKERQLRDLEPGDRVVVHTRLDPEDQDHLEVVAFRPETHSGRIESLADDKSAFVMKVDEGDDTDATFELAVPAQTPIEINKLTESEKQPYSYDSLKVGDRVVVHHSDDEAGMLALSIKALREVEKVGFVREISLRNRVLTIALNERDQDDQSFVRFPMYPDCTFKLNGLESLNDQLIRLNHLEPGDRVSVIHDAKAISIEAYRVFHAKGSVTKIDYDRSLVQLGNKWFGIGAESKIWLSGKPALFKDLRRGDRVAVTHDSPGDETPEVDRVTADRPADPKKWAILIANGDFEDRQIPSLAATAERANRLRETLINRYAIPPSQALICENFDRTRIEQEIPVWLSRVPDDAELFVYVHTHGQLYDGKKVFLASSDSELNQLEATSWKLGWLIDQLDAIGVTQKVLMLDCSHRDLMNPNLPPATPRQLVEGLRSTRRGGYPRSLYVLGSCSEGIQNEGVFAVTNSFVKNLTLGFSGSADLERDNEIQITELAEFAVKQAASESISRPDLILPNPSPPRVTARGRTAVLDILAHIEDRPFRRIEEEGMVPEVQAATELLVGEQDANLAFAIVLINHNRFLSAMEILEELRLKEPRCVQIHRTLAWVHFRKDRFHTGMAKLSELLQQIPDESKLRDGYDESTLQLFSWIGGLRQLAESQDWSKRQPNAGALSEFDNSLKRFGDRANKRVQQGRARILAVMKSFDEKVAGGDEEAGRERKRFYSYFGKFALEPELSLITARLDRQSFATFKE